MMSSDTRWQQSNQWKLVNLCGRPMERKVLSLLQNSILVMQWAKQVLINREKLNNWELLVRYGFAINDVPQIFKIEIELDMIKRSCTGKLRDNHAEGMVQKTHFLIDKPLCSPLNLTQLRSSDHRNFDLAPSSGQKYFLKNCWQNRFLRFSVIPLAPDWSKMTENGVK